MIRPKVITSGPSPAAFHFVGPLNVQSGTIRNQLLPLLNDHNRELTMRGLDPEGNPLRPWKVRKGTSDYHGRKYEAWNNVGVLAPYGEESRRQDDFTFWFDRSGVRQDGGGMLVIRAGWTWKSRGLPMYWRQRGRDVIGLGRQGRKIVREFLRTHLIPKVYFARVRSA